MANPHQPSPPVHKRASPHPPPPLPSSVPSYAAPPINTPPRSSSLPTKPPNPEHQINVTTEISSAIEHRKPVTLDSSAAEERPDSSQQPERRHRYVQLEPRSGGFALPRQPSKRHPSTVGAVPYFKYSDSSHCIEYTKSRHFNDICRLLGEEEDEAVTTLGHRRNRSSLSTLFRSHSEPRRWSAKQVGRIILSKRELPRNVIMQKTADGTRYGRIVTDSMDCNKPPKVERIILDKETFERRVERGYPYGINKDWGQTLNASAYQVNKIEKPKGKTRVKNAQPGWHASTGKKSQFAEAVTSSGNGSPLPDPKSIVQQPARRMPPELQTGERDSSVYNTQRNTSEGPPPMLPLPRSDSFHFDPMKVRVHDVMASGTSANSPKRAPSPTLSVMVKTESQPTLNHGLTTSKKAGFSSMLQTIRRRSRSPTKKIADEKAGTGSNASQHAAELSRFRQQIDYFRDAQTRCAAIPLEVVAKPSEDHLSRSSKACQEAASTSKAPPGTVGHSKSPSMVSTGSTAEDNRSDASSAVLSDAKSGTIYHGVDGKPSRTSFQTPPIPGPAPTTPLPSVPEGQGVESPSTPRNSMSEQGRDGPECSPPKAKSSPEKYSPFPRYNPTKGPPAPSKRSTDDEYARETEQKGPAVKVRISNAQKCPTLEQFPVPPESPPKISQAKSRRQGIAVSSGQVFPAELTGSAVETKRCPSPERAEKVAAKKMRDIARQRSQRAEVMNAHEDMPTSPKDAKDSNENEDIVHLPTPPPTESHSSLEVVSAYSEQQPNATDPATRLRSIHQHDDRNISQGSSILRMAEQAPNAPVQGTSSQALLTNDDSNDIHSVSAGARDIDFSPSGLTTVSADVIEGRPTSSSSIPPPIKPRSAARRAPTPYTPEQLRQSSERSSQRSSAIELNMEARVSRLEASNKMLVKAFMAVVEATAEMSASRSETVTWLSSGNSWNTAGRKSGASGISTSEDFEGNNSERFEGNGADRTSVNGGNSCHARDSGRESDNVCLRLEQILLGRPKRERFSPQAET
ncbi:MAG: hypothetical protein Q9217_000230 [Psora testacea]